MIRKVITIFLLFAFACGTAPTTDEEFHVPASLMLTSANLGKEEIGMVGGMVFEVESFDQWMYSYGEVSEGLIVAFRNVDDPDLTLIFEGSRNLEEAERKVERLRSEEFLSRATAFDDPIATFYEVKYIDKVLSPPDHFFALSYAFGGNPDENWPEFVQRNKDFFKEYFIEPAGIGTAPGQGDRAYLLFRQYDFVASRKMLNSPRKINKFLEHLGLPDQTLISYWIRISQAVE